MRFVKVLLIALMATLVAGCATGYRSEVNAIAKPGALDKRRFTVLPNEEVASGDPLQLSLFTQYVDRMLVHKGFYRAESRNRSDLLVYLGYSVSGPRSVTAYRQEPIYGQTGMEKKSTRQTNGNTTTTSTQYVPTYGVIGYKKVPYVETKYEYRVHLHAYDRQTSGRRDGQTTPIWEVNAYTSVLTNDLRRVFPYMVAAMAPYVGQTTVGKVDIRVPDDSPELRLILTGAER